MPLYQFQNDSGVLIDAHFEIQEGNLILCSRGGTLGTPNAKNTEYGLALRMLLERIEQSNLVLIGAWVDSSRVQNMPMEERQIFSIEDSGFSSGELFTKLSNRMAAVGRDPGKNNSRGNSTKRLRFVFADDPSDELVVSVIGLGRPDSIQHQSKGLLGTEFGGAISDNIYGIPPNPEDCEWAEGRPKLIQHLRRERVRRLVSIKKRKFIHDHGRLRCERCGLEPTKTYGPKAGDACIEVHHKYPLADLPLGCTTRLEDLICLCANCHRVLHHELRNATDKT